jgi:hypothetical protein
MVREAAANYLVVSFFFFFSSFSLQPLIHVLDDDSLYNLGLPVLKRITEDDLGIQSWFFFF